MRLVQQKNCCNTSASCFEALTDDQGIFSTYLDNEYALQALSLEKAKDEDGKEKYNRTRIYQWIDNLREMGINLSFAETSNQKNNW